MKYFRAKGTALSPPGPARGRTKARSTGDHLRHSTTSRLCAILAMQEPFASGVHAPPNTLMVRSHTRPSRRNNGSFSCEKLMLGISAGKSTKRTFEQLQQNRPGDGEDRRHGPAREGPALLQGLVICGRCGNRMTLRYYQRKHGTRLYPEYLCQKEQIEQAGDHLCQQVLGAGLDAAIADLLLAQLTPLAIDTSLQVYEELAHPGEQARRLRAQQVERARYAAELAQRRFLRSIQRIAWSRCTGSGLPRVRELTPLGKAEQRHFPRVWQTRAPRIEIANAWCVCCWKM